MDPASTLFNLILVVLLVLLNGFFVAAEFAMVKVRSSRIETLVMEGNLKAKLASKVTDNLDAFLSACQLGITLASLGLGWIGEPAVADIIHPLFVQAGLPEQVVHTISFAIAFSIITALHIVLGELAPKTMAIQKAEQVTLWVSVPLTMFYKIMYPFIWVLNSLANWILKAFGFELVKESEVAHTEEEIRIIMEESHKQGLIDNTELTLVDNIFDFAGRNAREIMIPRTDMVCLYTQKSFAENLEIALTENLTRYPVCTTDKDTIIGFVHIKDLMHCLAKGIDTASIDKIIRSVTYVPESMPISSVLKLLQKNKAQLAIVVDEYGGTAGIVTVEDILEEIVGEIQDEFDEEQPWVEVTPEGGFSVDGRMLIDEVNDLLEIELDSEECDCDTIGGWIYSRVELPLEAKKRIEYEGYEFIIEEIDNFRINRVLIGKMQEPAVVEEMI